MLDTEALPGIPLTCEYEAGVHSGIGNNVPLNICLLELMPVFFYESVTTVQK